MRDIRTLLLASLTSFGPLLGADLTGTWKISGDIQGNDVSPTCKIKLDESKITGECKSDNGDGAMITGEVKDDNITWTWEISGYTLVFTGKASSDTAIRGTIEVAGTGGTFTAAKQ